jgi:hypothetical protein
MKSFVKTNRHLLFIAMLLLSISCKNNNAVKNHSAPNSHGFIEVSKSNPSYFQFSDGSPYIPIGINLVSPEDRYRNNPDSGLIEYGQWMKKLSENGGNYFRVWLSNSFWDVEDKKAGEYSESKAQRIDRLIEMAKKYNIRVKLTLEHFRSLTMEENPQPWAVKSVYHRSNGGPLDSIRQYLTSAAGQKLFLNKADFYQKRYQSDTIFFGWELWNEMNAVSVPADSIFFEWNVKMLNEIKHRFPENLVMQSLGSFDNEKVRPVYKKMMLLPGNQVAQVHRYLDLGAEMEICHQPMDVICSSAVEELLSYKTGKPVILAETGAVQPNHAGPSKFYPIDTAGMLLHDILFAPFFSGAAGAGMSWHWDSYVNKNNLWYHFKRFSEVVKDINPLTENFVPVKSETNDLRIYQLNGSNTILLWLRDKKNTWESELRDGQPPLTIKGEQLDLKTLGINDSFGEISIYDPWQDKWQNVKPENMKISLPDFKRSLVVRFTRKR